MRAHTPCCGKCWLPLQSTNLTHLVLTDCPIPSTCQDCWLLPHRSCQGSAVCPLHSHLWLCCSLQKELRKDYSLSSDWDLEFKSPCRKDCRSSCNGIVQWKLCPRARARRTSYTKTLKCRLSTGRRRGSRAPPSSSDADRPVLMRNSPIPPRLILSYVEAKSEEAWNSLTNSFAQSRGEDKKPVWTNLNSYWI